MARRGFARRDARDAQVGRACDDRSVDVAGAGQMTRALWVCVAGVLLLAPQTTPGMDSRNPFPESFFGRPAELARVAGVVVTTDAAPQPVRRAIVTLSGGP